MPWRWDSAGVRPEYQPRRVFGQQGVDFQERVNFDRLRSERLQKLQAEMKRAGMPALLLMLGDNIRYATGTWDLTWKPSNQTRYCLVFPDEPPVLFETVGIDTEVVRMNSPWIADRLEPAITYMFAGPAFGTQLKRFVSQIGAELKKHAVSLTDPIGVDTLDFVSHGAFKEAGINIVPGGGPIREARLTKTVDEIELLKQAMIITDAAYHKARHEWVQPGVREAEVVGKVVDFCYSRGCQWVWGCNCASGGNTNPYLRAWTDKIIRPGDMVIMDMAMQGYLGYIQDYVRCWPCAAKFTPKQKDLYRRCYDYLQRALEAIKPGNTSADIAAAFPADDDFGDHEFKTCSLVQFAHTIGLGLYEGFWFCRGFSLDAPIELKPHMYLAVEVYAADPGGEEGCRLEENILVTDTGHEIFSLFPFEEEALG